MVSLIGRCHRLAAPLVSLLSFVSPALAAPIDTFWVIGQSNMMAAANTDCSLTPALGYGASVYDGALRPAAEPIGGGTGCGPWSEFLQTYAEAMGRPVLLITSPVGGTTQEPSVQSPAGLSLSWNDGGSLLGPALARLSAGLDAAKGADWEPHFIGTLYGDGESDALAIDGGYVSIGDPSQPVSAALYQSSLVGTIAKIQALYPGSFFYIVRLGATVPDTTAWQAIRDAQEAVAALYHDGAAGVPVSNVRIAYRGAKCYPAWQISGYGSFMKSDNIHYGAAGIRLLGKYTALGVVQNGDVGQYVIEPGPPVIVQCP